MPAPVTSEIIWSALRAGQFAVLGFVNPKGQPRTVGVVYLVRGRQLYVVTGRDTWKVRHIARNPNVSVTATIPKHIPFLPRVKIPAATVTFQGDAEVLPPEAVDPEILRTLMRGTKLDPETKANIVVIRIKPGGEFLTYGVGVSLITMRNPLEALGRAPVDSKTPAAA